MLRSFLFFYFFLLLRDLLLQEASWCRYCACELGFGALPNAVDLSYYLLQEVIIPQVYVKSIPKLLVCDHADALEPGIGRSFPLQDLGRRQILLRTSRLIPVLWEASKRWGWLHACREV